MEITLNSQKIVQKKKYSIQLTFFGSWLKQLLNILNWQELISMQIK